MRPRPDAGPLEMWIKAIGQSFPVVVRHRRIEVVLEVIEMVECD
jgi:hypothetical protein